MDFLAERQAAEAELTAVVGLDDQRLFQLAKALAARAEDNFEIVLSGGHIKLVLVVKGLLFKCGEFLLVFEIELHGVAEPRGDGAIELVGDAENIHFGMKLPLDLLELEGFGRDLDGQVDPGGVGRGVEERGAHGGGNGAGLRADGAILKVLLDPIPREEVHRFDVTVPAARPNVSSTAIHLDPQRMTASLQGFRGRIGEDVVLVQLLADSFQATEQVIGIGDYETTGAARQHIEDILIGGRRKGNLRDDLARQIEWIGAVGLAGNHSIGVATAGWGRSAPSPRGVAARGGGARSAATRGAAARSAAAGRGAADRGAATRGAATRPAAGPAARSTAGGCASPCLPLPFRG